jgi:hypothetical protein
MQMAGLALFLLAYFIYFSWDALRVHFAPDDMMNLGYAWKPMPFDLVLRQFLPWRAFYRPMAGLFYAPILHVFGLNPRPYHIAILCILLANVYLLYRLTKLLDGDTVTAGLVAVLACYHAGLSPLYYNIAFAYDVLCGLFYFCALVYYVRIRRAGVSFRVHQVLLFLTLYLCALNSKEMAVTLPVVMLVYEWFYQLTPQHWNRTELRQWMRGPGLVVACAVALNIAYIYGRLWAPGAMTGNPGYRPEFSLNRLLDFQILSFSDLFEKWNYFGWRGILIVWLLLFYLAWRRDRPILKFCWFVMLLTPLPIEFLENRGDACLYIPFAGWAIFMSTVFTDVARRVADFLGGEPVIRRLGPRRLFAAMIALGVFLWARQNLFVKHTIVKPVMDQMGTLTWDVIQQVRALKVHVRPNSTVAILHDPFEDYDMDWIFMLWLRDRSVQIWLERKEPHTPAELARADYVFDYQDGKLLQLR